MRAVPVALTQLAEGIPARVFATRTALLLGVALVLTACSPTLSPEGLTQQARELADGQGFTPRYFSSGVLTLAGFLKDGPGDRLVVYIEGDGRSWIDRRTPSDDPTPRTPTVLRMAGLDPSPRVLYLARPCQYLPPELRQGCSSHLWTSARYGRETLDTFNAALDQATRELGVTRMTLIGYSGGGTLAVLLAASRNDVDRVVTVAANLDTVAWSSHHTVSHLSASLNPIDNVGALAFIRQVHFAGAGDEICPPFLCEHFVARQNPETLAKCVIVPDVSHQKGWVDIWPELIRVHLWEVTPPID